MIRHFTVIILSLLLLHTPILWSQGESYLDNNSMVIHNTDLTVISGNIGIGMTNAEEKLDITGDTRYSKNVGFTEVQVPINAGSTVAIDWANGNNQRVLLNTAPATLTFSFTNPPNSATLYLVIDCKTNASATNYVFPNNVKWAIQETFTKTLNSVDIICLYYVNNTYYAFPGYDFKSISP